MAANVQILPRTDHASAVQDSELIDGVDKVSAQHYEEPALGPTIHPSPSIASHQDPNVRPDFQIKAALATLSATLFWCLHLFLLTTFSAYARIIVAALGGSNSVAWIFNAFNVVTIILAPILSWLSDVYGRKWFIIGCLAFGIIGSGVACRAKSTGVVIAGTALIGIAGAPLGLVAAIPSEVLPHRYRSFGQAFIFTIATLAQVAGLLGIGTTCQNDATNGWRWIFYTGLIGYSLQIVMWFISYSPPKRNTKLSHERPTPDYVGYVLLAAATVLFIAALAWGGGAHPWNSGIVIGTLVAGIVLYILFGLWEWKGRSDGLMHHRLFKDRNFGLTLPAIFIEGYLYLVFASSYPAGLATIYEPSLVKSGVLNLGFYVAYFVAAPIYGLWASKARDTITPILAGYILVTGAVIGLIFTTPLTKTLFVAMGALAGCGFPAPLLLLTVVGQFATPPEFIGTSTALLLSLRALGSAVGSVVSQVIASSKQSVKIPGYTAEATLPLGLDPSLLGTVITAATGNPQLIAEISAGQVPGVSPEVLAAAFEAVHRAFSDSYKYVYIAAVPFCVIGTASILTLKRNKGQQDYIVDAPLQDIHHRHADKEAAGV